MKFKIDEDLPVEVAGELRARGYDAMSVVDQGMAGADDRQLMARVEQESRIMVTLDKGIANIHEHPPGRYAGLVLLRPNQAGRGAVLKFIRERLTQLVALDLKGRLVVLSETGIRIR